jgi:hypothetical protein
MVRRSEHHSAKVEVGAWEILMLQYEHSPEKVEILGFKRIEGRGYPDPQQEFERLGQRYGIDTESGASKVSLVYGQGQMGVMNLRNLIEQERKQEDGTEVLETVSNVVELPAAPTPAAPAPATEVIPSVKSSTLSLPKGKDAAAA